MRLGSIFASAFSLPFTEISHFLRPRFNGTPMRRRRYRSGPRFYKPNGKREVARRLRQIQAGQLRVSQ